MLAVHSFASLRIDLVGFGDLAIVSHVAPMCLYVDCMAHFIELYVLSAAQPRIYIHKKAF